MKKNLTLHDDLLALPLYGSYECAGIASQCTHPACIRHPMTGKFYGSGHAVELAESHQADMEDIRQALKLRQRMLKNALECDDCEKPAERICAYCYAPICFDHMKYIPRTGAACDGCALQLEREAEARGFWG